MKNSTTHAPTAQTPQHKSDLSIPFNGKLQLSQTEQAKLNRAMIAALAILREHAQKKAQGVSQ